MHAARHGWDVEKDAPLFRNWAIHTGIGTLFFAGQIFTLFSLLKLHFPYFLSVLLLTQRVNLSLQICGRLSVFSRPAILSSLIEVP